MTACAVFATCVFTACGTDEPVTPENPEVPEGPVNPVDPEKPEGSDPTDNIINPSVVFTGKRVSNFNGSKMTYDEKGLLIKIENTDETVTFTYPTVTKSTGSTEVHVKMIIDDGDPLYGGKIYIDMTIGKNGFAESAIETYEKDSDIETWAFKYAQEGHLNWMKRSEGDNEITTITYKDNDITEVEMHSEGSSSVKSHPIIAYGSQPMENKGCIMLFDETFGIDMDEMKYAYWAGLLGKATKHLPVSESYDDGTATFKWNFNVEGYPKDMTISSTDNSTPETIHFGW